MTPTTESALEKVLDLWPRHYPPAADARAELAALRRCEAWILEHAQHGAACRVPLAEGHPCTCGLGKIMEEMS